MNSVHCTSGLPYRAAIKRKAASVTPSMGARPIIGCGSVCQKLIRLGCPLLPYGLDMRVHTAVDAVLPGWSRSCQRRGLETIVWGPGGFVPNWGVARHRYI